MRAVSRGLIGALEKFEQSSVGIGGLAHGFVGQDELPEVGVESGLRRRDGVLRVAGRLGVGVAVKERLDTGGPAAPGQNPQLLTS